MPHKYITEVIEKNGFHLLLVTVKHSDNTMACACIAVNTEKRDELFKIPEPNAADFTDKQTILIADEATASEKEIESAKRFFLLKVSRGVTFGNTPNLKKQDKTEEKQPAALTFSNINPTKTNQTNHKTSTSNGTTTTNSHAKPKSNGFKY